MTRTRAGRDGAGRNGARRDGGRRRLERDEGGQALAVFLVFMPLIMVGLAFAVTLSYVREAHLRLAEAASYAALAGADDTSPAGSAAAGAAQIDLATAPGRVGAVFARNLSNDGLAAAPGTAIVGSPVCYNASPAQPWRDPATGVAYRVPVCYLSATTRLVAMPFGGIVRGLLGHGPFTLTVSAVASPVQYGQNRR